jgi:exodeoxyribonuclease VII large subunit
LTDFDGPHSPSGMNELPSGVSNLTELSVSELSNALKRVVEDNFDYVRVRGEISGFKRATSGHLYMSLKDTEAVLDAICWRGVAEKLKVKPEDGLEVVVTGKLTTYPGRSKYQIIIQSMAAAGIGALMALLEARRTKLAAEGLFDAGRKKPIPYLPQVIGVVTSPTGAVIKDILHRLADRFPRHVLVWPVLVQGDTAAAQIAAAIKGFNAIAPGGPVARPDLLIVARGGGSLEDLWAFNEEIVVRAAAESQIPLISAVGHETDTTLIDYASDLRAPTPTAAAELAVPVRSELLYTLSDYNRRLDAARSRHFRLAAERLKALARALPTPADLLGLKMQRFDSINERLPRAALANLQVKRGRLEGLARALRPTALTRETARGNDALARAGLRLGVAFSRHIARIESDFAGQARLLESFSYHKTLERGYAVVRLGAGGLVTGVAQALPGLEVDVEFRDGHVGMQVAGKLPPKSPKPQKAEVVRGRTQGTLL